MSQTLTGTARQPGDSDSKVQLIDAGSGKIRLSSLLQSALPHLSADKAEQIDEHALKY